MATGTNTLVLDSWLYLVFLLVAAWLAAAPASLAEFTTWERLRMYPSRCTSPAGQAMQAQCINCFAAYTCMGLARSASKSVCYRNPDFLIGQL